MGPMNEKKWLWRRLFEHKKLFAWPSTFDGPWILGLSTSITLNGLFWPQLASWPSTLTIRFNPWRSTSTTQQKPNWTVKIQPGTTTQNCETENTLIPCILRGRFSSLNSRRPGIKYAYANWKWTWTFCCQVKIFIQFFIICWNVRTALRFRSQSRDSKSHDRRTPETPLDIFWYAFRN